MLLMKAPCRGHLQDFFFQGRANGDPRAAGPRPSGVLGRGLRAPSPLAKMPLCRLIPVQLWTTSPLAELGGLEKRCKLRMSGEELRRMLDFFVQFFLPLDDLWRLRFLPLISCVYGKIGGMASQSQICEKFETYKHWPS